MAPLPAAAALMDELVEEILFRVPPDDPARLLRAALACKRWFRIVSDAGFRRRYREYHRTPPMLGFLRNHWTASSSSFVSTSSFRTPLADRVDGRAIDVRHGRVLLQSRERGDREAWNFYVWDPITGERRELPVLLPGPVYPLTWNAAVLCAAATEGCEHLDCHRGPFLVVFVGGGGAATSPGCIAHVYSSEADAWSKQISAPHVAGYLIRLQPSAFAENALYFSCMPSVLKYDLATRELSLIPLPEERISGHNLLMATEDGGLGLANICSRRLYLWSWKAGPDEDAGWVSKVIKLTTLLPAEDTPGSLSRLVPTGFAHGLHIILLATSVGIFTIDLKSMHVAKVCEERWCDDSLPFMSFCTPALGAASVVGSRTGTSNA